MKFTIKINNWKKYNSWTQERVKRPWWVKLSNEIHLDQDFLDFNNDEKWAWICFICEASKQRSDTLIIDTDFHGQIWRISSAFLHSCAVKLKEKHIVKLNLHEHKCVADKIRGDKRRLDKRRLDILSDSKESDGMDWIVELWNQSKGSLPALSKLTCGTKRYNNVKRRLKEIPDKEKWADIFRKVQESDFLSGRDGKWLGMSFDWIFKNAENPVKILEGVYSRNKNQTNDVDDYLDNWVKKQKEKENATR